MDNSQHELRIDVEPLQEGENFNCQICFNLKPSIQKFSNDRVCVHPFCWDCIIEYIEVEVTRNVTNLKCPDVMCSKVLDPISCRPMIPSELFVKWCNNLCGLTVSKYQKCYCPNLKCSELVVNECGGNVTKINCPICKTCFCFKCKCRWHAGYWCRESGLLKDKNDILFGELIKRNKWNKCPSCGHIVEHIGGCPKMKCRCGKSFYYKSGNNWCILIGLVILLIVFLLIIFGFVCPFLCF